MTTYNTSIVGLYFRPAEAKAAAKTVQPSDELHAIREPENSHDPYAVRIEHDNTHIGYIPRDVALMIAPEMDDGAKAVVIVTSIVTNTLGARGLPHINIAVTLE